MREKLKRNQRNKKWIEICLMIVVILLLIGGIGKMKRIVFDKTQREEQKASEKVGETMVMQKEIVQYIADNYIGVEKIELGEFVQTKETGFWNTRVIVNDENIISFTMPDITNIDDFSIRTNPASFKLKRDHHEADINNIEVLYWEGE